MSTWEIIKQLDAKDEIKSAIAHGWNDRARRFTDKKTGKFLSQNQVKSVLNDGISTGKNKLQDLATSLSSGKIDITKFLIESSQTIKELHILNSVLAVGGRADQMTIGQKTALQNRVKEQLTGGKDPITKEKYGFNFLIRDLVNGEISELQLKNRISMFAGSAELTQHHIQKESKIDNGMTEGFRQLGSTDKHCLECINYGAMGWTKIEDLIMPGSSCSCFSNCKCSIIYR